MERNCSKLACLTAPLVLLLFPAGALSQNAAPAGDPVLEALLKAEREGRLAEAEKLLDTAVREAEEQVAPSRRLSLLLNHLASLNFQKGRYSAAVAAAKRALAMDEKLFGPESPRVVTDLSNLGTFSEAAGDDDAAEQAFRQALAVARDHPEPRAAGLLMVLNNLSSFYLTHNRPADAEPLLEEGLQVCEKSSPGPIVTSCASFRRDLATALRREGKPGAAEGLVADAVAVAPDSSPQWRQKVTDLETLAQQYEEDHAYDLAEATYRQAMALIEKNTKPDGPRFLLLELNRLGELLEKEGRNSEAEDLFKRALDLQEQAAGPKHPDLAASLLFDYLVNLYRTEGRLPESELIIEQGLVLQERVLGPQHEALSRSLLALAGVYEEEQKYGDAEPLYRRALEIQRVNLGPDDSRLLPTLDRYAALLRLLDQQDRAREITARAEVLRQKLAEQNSK